MTASHPSKRLQFLVTLALAALVAPAAHAVIDNDGDGIPAGSDNCPLDANANQMDTDDDGIGNACDADFDQNGAVGASDYAIALAAFGSVVGDPHYNPHVDYNVDGAIGSLDLFRVMEALGTTVRAPETGEGVDPVAVVQAAFGSRKGETRYDPAADLDGDGVVGSNDFNLALQLAESGSGGLVDPVEVVTAAFGTAQGDPRFDPAADLNGDGVVGAGDYNLALQLASAATTAVDPAQAVAAAFGSQKGDSRYDPDADLDGDGVIGAQDMAIALTL